MPSAAPRRLPDHGPRFTLEQCNAMLPLVRAIATEVIERRQIQGALRRRQRELQRAHTPEGLVSALADLDTRLWEQETGILNACREILGRGLSIQTINPLVVHFPGERSDTVCCWREDEAHITHQHARGSESEPECTAVTRKDAFKPGTRGA